MDLAEPSVSSPAASTPPSRSPQAQSRGHHHVFELPRLTAMLKHALPPFLEGVIAPVAVFYAALVLLGLNGALVAAVGWVYVGILWRVIRRQRVSGMLM